MKGERSPGGLSRDDRKLQSVELLFKKLEDRARRLTQRRQHPQHHDKSRVPSPFISCDRTSTKEWRQRRTTVRRSLRVPAREKKRDESEGGTTLVERQQLPFPSKKFMSSSIFAETPSRLRFSSKEDFGSNFGKENWLLAYQSSEIEKNKNNPEEPEGLGTVQENEQTREYVRKLIERTRQEQARCPRDKVQRPEVRQIGAKPEVPQ